MSPAAAATAFELTTASHDATSFYAVKCAPGFQCASKLSRFPLGHDGVYPKIGIHRALEPADPDRFRDWLNTYEVGCPARGKVTQAGRCKDDGTEGQGFCFSATSYEAGPGMPCEKPDDCLCVQAQTSDGKQSLSYRNLENDDGKELLQGKYKVQEGQKCDFCGQLGTQSQCLHCPNCVFKEKSDAGIKKLGCWDKDAGQARRDRMNGTVTKEYLNGAQTHLKELNIVPHYRLWDPGEAVETTAEEGSKEEIRESRLAESAGPRRPEEGMGEPLSRDVWIERYKTAVPLIQKQMDGILQRLVKWASKANRLKCIGGHEAGNDILGFVEEATSDQGACFQMQETAQKIGTAEDNLPTLNCHSNTSESGVQKNLEKIMIKNMKCERQFDKQRYNEMFGIQERKSKAPAGAKASATPAAAPSPALPFFVHNLPGKGRRDRKRAMRQFLFDD